MTFSISRRGLAGIGHRRRHPAAGFLVKSAQADTLEETLKNNVLRVGINPNSPPFSSRNVRGRLGRLRCRYRQHPGRRS